MALSVIGAGFGRTGTLSLKLALESLGAGPCYHMLEVRQNPGHGQHWLDALAGRPVSWDALFHAYRASCDWPQCHFWRELALHYPNARVILTVRDPERWYASITRTIFPALEEQPDAGDPDAVVHRTMTRKLIFEQTFAERWKDEEHVIGVYERHVATVRREIPAARLLVYDVSQGWGPLCAFLRRPVPDIPFPNVNSTAEFQARGRARHDAAAKPGTR